MKRTAESRVWVWLLPCLFVPLAILYLHGSLTHAERVNTDPSTFDQSAYLNYARKMRATGYAHVGSRDRMPLYPFLQSLVYRPDRGEEARFRVAKRLNIALSVAILSGLFLLLRRRLPLSTAIELILITAFLVFVFKAAYVQCDLLYYGLGFCAFLLMLETLESASWKHAAAAGTCLGLAHLTKASASPGLLIFLAVGASFFLYRAMKGSTVIGQGRPRPMAGLAAIGLTGLMFLVVVFPYIRTSKRVFGRYFYNVNTTFYVWYDTHEQVAKGTRLHGDREGWPQMPADEIPGPEKWLREHTAGQALDRVAGGLRELHHTASRSYGYYKYLLLYAGFALAVVIARPRAWFPLEPVRSAQALFCLSYFAGYLVLFAWGTASVWGANRNGLQLFLPMIYSFALVHAASRRRLPPLSVRGSRLHLSRLFELAILCLLIPDIYLVLSERLLSMAGGH